MVGINVRHTNSRPDDKSHDNTSISRLHIDDASEDSSYYISYLVVVFISRNYTYSLHNDSIY